MIFPTRRTYKEINPIAKLFPIAMLCFDLMLSLGHSMLNTETYQKVFYYCVPNIGTSTIWTAALCYLAFHFEMCAYAKVAYVALLSLSILDAVYFFSPFGEVYYLYGVITATSGLLITIIFIVKNKGL